MGFSNFNSPKKPTKHCCPSRLGQKLTLSSSFFGRIEDSKISFEINWPLENPVFELILPLTVWNWKFEIAINHARVSSVQCEHKMKKVEFILNKTAKCLTWDLGNNKFKELNVFRNEFMSLKLFKEQKIQHIMCKQESCPKRPFLYS